MVRAFVGALRACLTVDGRRVPGAERFAGLLVAGAWLPVHSARGRWLARAWLAVVWV